MYFEDLLEISGKNICYSQWRIENVLQCGTSDLPPEDGHNMLGETPHYTLHQNAKFWCSEISRTKTTF
jgi:hypothetical protein